MLVPTERVVIVDERGDWCPHCLRPSVIAASEHLVSDLGVTPWRSTRYCTDCQRPIPHQEDRP